MRKVIRTLQLTSTEQNHIDWLLAGGMIITQAVQWLFPELYAQPWSIKGMVVTVYEQEEEK